MPPSPPPRPPDRDEPGTGHPPAAHDASDAFAREVLSDADGLWDWDIAQGLVRVASPWAQGERDARIETQEAWGERIHPDDLQSLTNTVRAHLEGRTSAYRHEHRIRGADGRWHWRLAKGMIVERDAGGRPTRMAGIHTDISARKAFEQALASREAEYRALFEESSDATFLIDDKGRFLDVNAAACRLLQRERAQLCGMGIEDVIAPRELATRPVDYVALRAGNHMVFNRTLLRSDGAELPGEVSLRRMPDGRHIAVVRDTSERLRLEQAERARQVAEAASRAKTDFMARVSHELRTPLNAVIGFSDLILHPGAFAGLDRRVRRFVRQIRQSGEHLLLLINDILDLSKIEAGALSLSLSDVDVVPVLRSAAEELRAPARDGHVALDLYTLPSGPLWVRADPMRLRQVVVNLLSNAIKYNRAGGRVLVTVAASGQRVQVAIADTGLGMTPQQLHHLFQPFNRLGRESGTVAGSGVGLVLVRQLLTLMHGDMTVDSEPGRGSTFTFELPAASGAAQPATPFAPANAGLRELPPASGRVLYVEDDEVNQLLLQAQLSIRPDVEVEVAGDGRSGLERAREWIPDAIIIDINLPDMNGIDLLQRLREDERLRHIPCAALSANAMPRDVAAAREAGFDRYITKPVTAARLAAELDELMADGAARGAEDRDA